MSTINYSDQLNYVGEGYIDAKMQPVATVKDLNNILRTQRFKGLTVTVLDDGNGLGPRDYWITTNTARWVLKESPSSIKIDGGDVEEIQ